MSQIPQSHIVDSHKLVADGRVELYEIVPANTVGVVRITPDNDVTWLGNTFTGMPMTITGEKKTSDAGLTMPKLSLGQENIDLSIFKGIIFDGSLDNAVITKYTVLVDNILNNRNIREMQIYRVKRVEGYSRSKIDLQLATLSDSLGFSLPYRQFNPPDFPTVQMT